MGSIKLSRNINGHIEQQYAYWKRKFFETMCSECFYVIDWSQASRLHTCPGCGRRMIDKYDFNYDAQSGGRGPDCSGND